MSLRSEAMSRLKDCLCSGTKCENKLGDGVSQQCLLDYYEIETPAVTDVAAKRMEIERKMGMHRCAYPYSHRQTIRKLTRQNREKREPPECKDPDKLKAAQEAFDEIRALLDSINGSPDENHYEELKQIVHKTPFIAVIPIDSMTRRATYPETAIMAITYRDWDERQSKMVERIGEFVKESRNVVNTMRKIKYFIEMSECHRTIEKDLVRRKVKRLDREFRRYLVQMNPNRHNEEFEFEF